MQVYSAIPNYFVRSDQGFIREAFHKSPADQDLLIPIHRTKKGREMYYGDLLLFPACDNYETATLVVSLRKKSNQRERGKELKLTLLTTLARHNLIVGRASDSFDNGIHWGTAHTVSSPLPCRGCHDDKTGAKPEHHPYLVPKEIWDKVPLIICHMPREFKTSEELGAWITKELDRIMGEYLVGKSARGLWARRGEVELPPSLWARFDDLIIWQAVSLGDWIEHSPAVQLRISVLEDNASGS